MVNFVRFDIPAAASRSDDRETMQTRRPTFVTRAVPRLTLQGARLIMAAAARRAAALGAAMDIAVVDDGGHLIAFNRMDGAKLSSVDVAISKAWTAACTRRPTHDYAEIAGAGKPAFGINVSNGGRFMIVGGGLPITLGGVVIGGIGCSSGTVQQDRDVATAGIRALQHRLGDGGRAAAPRARRRTARDGAPRRRARR
jgi:uncharacterized protein GlcG (DUF336 family)